MKSILEELFSGGIYPDELIVSRNPEYRPLNRKISETMKMWRDKLPEHEFLELEELLGFTLPSRLHARRSSLYVWI